MKYLKDRDGNDTMYPDFESMDTEANKILMGLPYSTLEWFLQMVTPINKYDLDWSTFWAKISDIRFNKEWSLEDELQDRLNDFAN